MEKKIAQGTLHKAGEDYLEAILRLEQEKGTVRSVDVADYLAVSKPSVSRAVSVLGQAGYLTMKDDRSLRLTRAGRAVAEKIYERHSFFKKLFMDLGVDGEIAEQDACRIEHDISEDSFERLREMVEKDGIHSERT